MSVYSMSLPLVGASSATSGLIFVFLGLTVSKLQAMERNVQRIVAPKLVLKSWIAFVGLFLSTSSAILSMLTMWWMQSCAIWIALGLWVVSLILVMEVHDGS